MAFFAVDNIQTGEELSEALFGAIEESLISLVIFSENYASSRWCLLELEKILKCRRKNGQFVMRIFYKVDPSDVRYRRRTYGDAFVKHERKYSLTVQSWRSAWSESADLSGFHSFFDYSLQPEYDVFVSFRGSDVREGFLSHLIEAFSLNQIASFGDDNIPKGHKISDVLLRAIEVSSIYLIIFSENYVSSSWCLLELVKIVECSRNGHILLPIFYKVDPSDVRHQRGSYGEAFVAHDRQYNPTTVQTWRFALKESANVAGFHSSTFRNDAKLVKEIVKSVLNLRHKVNSKEAYEIGTQFPHAEPLLQIKLEDLPVIRSIEVPYNSAATLSTVFWCC
ncbi:disease resistance protein RPV1-like isoform X2 [Phaseolus vulgaris]|uniref:disease resistance protein RPV1-like isoform X2 n=1 Tax=Phaseolus vulgaris TaxID=3885 RepID=UPI0035CC770E